MTKLLTFEEIFEMKIEMEQAEKISKPSSMENLQAMRF